MRWRIPLVAVLALFVAVSCQDSPVGPSTDQISSPLFNTVTLNPIVDPAGGSFYQAVADLDVTWQAAFDAAAALTFRECQGHLATITSQAENDFITNTFPEAAPGGYWLGGVQAPGSAEPAGGWSWITGEPFDYTNWNGGEPNDARPCDGCSEDRIHFAGPFTAPENATFWNDEYQLNVSGGIDGWVVEFDCEFKGGVIERVSVGGNDACGALGLPNGCDANFSLTAHEKTDGTVTGQWQDTFAGGQEGIHVAIDCLNMVGNAAVIGGVITNGTIGGVDVTGQRALTAVADNGTSKDDPPDQISFSWFPVGELTCYQFTPDEFPFPFLDLVNGQVTVK